MLSYLLLLPLMGKFPDGREYSFIENYMRLILLGKKNRKNLEREKEISFYRWEILNLIRSEAFQLTNRWESEIPCLF